MEHKPGTRYSLVKNEMELDGTVFESFGISLDRGGGDVLNIPDISTDREKIKYMVDQFNELDLAESHVFDVIEDMLQ